MSFLKRSISSLFLALLLFLLSPQASRASNQFITIVNPVRVSSYTANPQESLSTEYLVISQNNFPATWLLTYDALDDEGIYSVVKKMDYSQEIGIFLEVTPKLAESSKVSYNNTGFWHHATAIFLSGYTQEERIKLVDRVFAKFKERFGYYPTSVGSWWTDSFSLSYMKEKYGITANLTCSDQYSTDGYQIWGQYWSTPFYPSKFHTAMPAASESAKLDIVNFQWAARDPLNGYKSSFFSTQDYLVLGLSLDSSYFEKLVRFYASRNLNHFGQITIGLESDLSPEVYTAEYKEQLAVVKKLLEEKNYTLTTMKNFSDWYRSTFKNLSPVQTFVSDDFLGKPEKAIWYQSPRYRILIVYDVVSQKTKIADFRSYHDNFYEPYFFSPNRQFTLDIYIPSYLDEVNYSLDKWEFDFGEVDNISREGETLRIKYKGNQEIILSSEKILIKGEKLTIPKSIAGSYQLNVLQDNNLIEISPNLHWSAPPKGRVFFALTPEATHLLGSKKLILFLVFSLTAYFLILLRTSFLRKKRKLVFVVSFFFFTLAICSWYLTNLVRYSVSQAELDVLARLSLQEPGKVMVYDKECLQCSWHGEFRPAVFANKRGYVARYGKHPVVYEKKVFELEQKEEAIERFKKLGVKYIYLVTIEEYTEKMPFSPGDFGIELLYKNANAKLWRVVN